MLAGVACGSGATMAAPAERQDAQPAVMLPTERPTERPTITADTLRYLEDAASLLDQTGSTLLNFSILWGMVGEDALMLLDYEWLDYYESTEREMYGICRRYRALDAPTELAGVQREIENFCDDMEDSLDLARVGIDNLDVDSLEASVDALERANGHVDSILTEIERAEARY
jgi:hypothetical protein